jgi:hypothetical protein
MALKSKILKKFSEKHIQPKIWDAYLLACQHAPKIRKAARVLPAILILNKVIQMATLGVDAAVNLPGLDLDSILDFQSPEFEPEVAGTSQELDQLHSEIPDFQSPDFEPEVPGTDPELDIEHGEENEIPDFQSPNPEPEPGQTQPPAGNTQVPPPSEHVPPPQETANEIPGEVIKPPIEIQPPQEPEKVPPPQDTTPDNQISDDKVPEDKIPEDKEPEDKIPEDKIPEDKVPEDKDPDIIEGPEDDVIPNTGAAAAASSKVLPWAISAGGLSAPVGIVANAINKRKGQQEPPKKKQALQISSDEAFRARARAKFEEARVRKEAMRPTSAPVKLGARVEGPSFAPKAPKPKPKDEIWAEFARNRAKLTRPVITNNKGLTRK